MEALPKKGFNFRLDNLGELLGDHEVQSCLFYYIKVLKTKKPESMITSRLYAVRRFRVNATKVSCCNKDCLGTCMK